MDGFTVFFFEQEVALCITSVVDGCVPRIKRVLCACKLALDKGFLGDVDGPFQQSLYSLVEGYCLLRIYSFQLELETQRRRNHISPSKVGTDNISAGFPWYRAAVHFD